MSADAVSTSSRAADVSPRRIALRTRGHSHGPITRLVSPDDLGQHIKPFVFLDYFEADPTNAPRFGFHPHSGIATLTLILSGQAFYKETTDREGVIDTGGVEWMRASGGVWHTGGTSGKERTKGFQLWVALPPSLELAEPAGQYITASDFELAGPARVIAGEYGGIKSIIASPSGMTYLDVRLKPGERWRYTPPQDHNVAWVAPHQGRMMTPFPVEAGEVVVFEEGDQSIEFEAVTDAAFVLGSAAKHPYDLVTGHYSVHTTLDALRQGEQNIANIGRRLHNQGVLSPAARRSAGALPLESRDATLVTAKIDRS